MPASDVLCQTSPGSFAKLSHASHLILHQGWAAATVRHYAAAVNRYFCFAEQRGHHSFPISTAAVYDFICWCRDNEDGHTVRSKTAKHYLTGLKMWHVLHDVSFPPINPHRIRLLFKASRSSEVSTAGSRPGATLSDIHRLYQLLNHNSRQSLVLRGVILVCFWGLARLGEVTKHADHPLVFIRRKDVVIDSNNNKATIRLRLAKTAAPGEDQYLKLRRQPNCLDPISAIVRILKEIPGRSTDPIFPDASGHEPIKREAVLKILQEVHSGGRALSGHSLRIGGASLRAHYGNPISSLKKAGRWRSSCYQLYLRKYSKRVASETATLAKNLRRI